MQLHVEPKRNHVLKAIFDLGWVTLGPEAAKWQSKTHQLDVIQGWSASAATHFPRTYRLDRLPGDAETRAQFIAEHFSQGFLLKPDVGHSSDGQGFIHDLDGVEDLLAAGHGAAWLIQESMGEADTVRPREFRAHTFWNRVVTEATYSRWDLFWNEPLFREIEVALQAWLDGIPAENLKGQAWGLDVFRRDNGEVVILDLNTSRGARQQWSGDLSIPDALGAHVRHWERYHAVEFSGEAGELLRSNSANREKWLRKVGPDAVARHEGLRQTAARDRASR